MKRSCKAAFRLGFAAFAFACIVGSSCAAGHGATDREIVTLIAAGEVEAARQIYEQGTPSAADWQFFEGRVAKADGDFSAAKTRFRKALALQPGHLPAQRELAHTLMLAGDRRAARAAFGALLRDDPNLSLHKDYRGFLQQMKRGRAFAISGNFAIVSSSNVNRGSSRSIFEPGVPGIPALDITSKAEPNTGVQFGLRGRHVWPLQDFYAWRFDWGLDHARFAEAKHNRASLSSKLHIGRFTPQGSWSVGPVFRLDWRSGGDNSTLKGASFELERPVSSDARVFLSSSAARRSYTVSDGLSGALYSAQIGYLRQVPRGHLSIRGAVRRNIAQNHHQSYTGLTLGAKLTQDWKNGLSTAFGLEIGTRDFRGDFPLAGKPREDRFHQLSVSLQHRSIEVRGLSPVLRCIHGKTRSNVAFYDHHVRECTIEIVTRF